MRTTILMTTLLLGYAVPAQEPGKPDRPEDRAAIADLNKSFLDAFNAGDAKMVAATFADDAQVVSDEGEILEGKAAIEAYYEETLTVPPQTKMTLEPGPLRFLTADVAIEDGVAKVATGPGEPVEHSNYTVSYVKKNGKWLQAHVTDHATEQPPAHKDHLKALSFLVGEWVSEGSDALVNTKCEWADGGNYLIRSYDVVREGKPELKGTERIVWDPLSKRIRSWIFDDSGGFGEATWLQKDAQTWTLHASGVSRDGEATTLTRTVTKLAPHRIQWTQRDLMIAGKPAEAPGDYVMVQPPPKPKRP